MNFGQSPQPQHHYTTPMQHQQMFNTPQHQIRPLQNMSYSESYANSSRMNDNHQLQVLSSPLTSQPSYYDNGNGTDDSNGAAFRLHQPNVNFTLFRNLIIIC